VSAPPSPMAYSDGKVANRYVSATPADSPRQWIVARAEGYTYAANVWGLSLVQGPFSVAPCQTLSVRFANFFIRWAGFGALRGASYRPAQFLRDPFVRCRTGRTSSRAAAQRPRRVSVQPLRFAILFHRCRGHSALDQALAGEAAHQVQNGTPDERVRHAARGEARRRHERQHAGSRADELPLGALGGVDVDELG
jgi:hypothetical protein